MTMFLIACMATVSIVAFTACLYRSNPEAFRLAEIAPYAAEAAAYMTGDPCVA